MTHACSAVFVNDLSNEMSARYTQSKAETARHLDILKGMLKRPENKASQHHRSTPPPHLTRPRGNIITEAGKPTGRVRVEADWTWICLATTVVR